VDAARMLEGKRLVPQIQQNSIPGTKIQYCQD